MVPEARLEETEAGLVPASTAGSSSPEDTQDTTIADAAFPPSEKTRYPGDLLPG